MTAARLPCCVPFCRRTTRNDRGWAEWLCPRHWRLVDAEIKALRRRVRRKGRHRLDDMLWRRAKRQAIDRALSGGPKL
jgi:hypothetical protein